MIPYNSQDGAIPKTAPSSGQHCASELGKVCSFLLKALSASYLHDNSRHSSDVS
jgi:hypothetical protein